MRNRRLVLGLCILTLLVIGAAAVSAANIPQSIIDNAEKLAEAPAGFAKYLEGPSFFANPMTYAIGIPIIIVVLLLLRAGIGARRRYIVQKGDIRSAAATSAAQDLISTLEHAQNIIIDQQNATYREWNKTVDFCKGAWPKRVPPAIGELRNFNPPMFNTAPNAVPAGINTLRDLYAHIVVPAPAAPSPQSTINFNDDDLREQLLNWIEAIEPNIAYILRTPLPADTTHQARAKNLLDQVRQWARKEKGKLIYIPGIRGGMNI